MGFGDFSEEDGLRLWDRFLKLGERDKTSVALAGLCN